MEQVISPANLVPPSLAHEVSEATLTNAKNDSNIKGSSPVQQSNSNDNKTKSIRFKISRKEARNLPFDVYNAYDKPVKLDEILDEVSSTIRVFVIIDKVQADAAALWIFHTYVVDLFDTSPIAIINAPERACAKTLFQTILADLSCRALMASNATPSSLFRSIELWMVSIFFDEVDTFFKDNSDMVGMVNAGYKSKGFVLRSEAIDDSFEPRKFSVFSAKSLAGIALEKHLPDSTMSRGIVFNMRRKLAGETVTRLRYAEPGLFPKLCAKLERAADDYEEAIQKARPDLPDALSDRAQDNWEPLLAIASVAGDGWLERATEAALILSCQSNEKVSTGNELLADIQSIFEKRMRNSQSAEKISSADLIDELTKIEDSPWATYNHGHPLSPRQLATQLSVYGIKSKTVRLGAFATPKGYELSQFEDVFARYLHITDQSANTEDATLSDAIQDGQAPSINQVTTLDNDDLFS